MARTPRLKLTLTFQRTLRASSAEQLEHFVQLGVKDNTEKTFDHLVRRFEAGAAVQQARV